MLPANEARKLSEKNKPNVSSQEIINDIECQIRKTATNTPQKYLNYFNVDWRQTPQVYNDVIYELESNGYNVEYVPSFDSRDPRDTPYLTIRW